MASLGTVSLRFRLLMLLLLLVFYPVPRPSGRSRRRWEDNIRMDLEEIVIYVGNWVDWAQDRNYWRALVNAALDLRVP